MRFILGVHRGARRYREVQGGMQRGMEGEQSYKELHGEVQRCLEGCICQ